VVEAAPEIDGHCIAPAPLGRPLRPHTWVKSLFKPALRAAGLPEGLRPYDLRHTCASLLIAQDASVKAVQARLGHATASITLDTYGHLFPSELEALADRLQQARAAALAHRERTQRGPGVVPLGERAGGWRGGGGIRTHGALSGPATFKVAAFGQLGHSSADKSMACRYLGSITSNGR
jgi:Phage integrase family